MSNEAPPVWRSALFIAATERARIAKIPERHADLAILDLEDAIAPDDKETARAALPSALATLAGQSQSVAVRVNAERTMMAADLDAAVRPGLAAVMLPKTEDPADLDWLSEMIAARETTQGLEVGGIRVIALIETPRALSLLPHIASARRVSALALGSEDFSASLGWRPPSTAWICLPA